jgi:hypothetical protein
MKTIKEILTENRTQVLSTIIKRLKPQAKEDLVKIMNDFIFELENHKDVNVKGCVTFLEYINQVKKQGNFLQSMIERKSVDMNMKKLDTRNWKEVKHDYAEKIGCEVNTRTGNFYKL